MKLFDYLDRKRKIQFLRKSPEYPFYLQNKDVLNIIPQYDMSILLVDDFDLIKANIIIQALNNKKMIENALDLAMEHFRTQRRKASRTGIVTFMKASMDELPCLEENGEKIYIPLFSRSLNMIYANEPEKLLSYPYNELREEFITTLVDPFETYNYSLYDSKFTSLIRIGGDRTSMAFYHFDYKTIYMINDQGRLDIAIPLFDRGMKRISTNHLIERITIVVDAFYSDDRERFIAELYQQKLISYKLYRKFLNKKDGRLHSRLFRLRKED